MRKFFLALTFLSLSLSTAVSSTAALAEDSHSGAPEEQKACIRDVQKFCRPVIDQGDFTVLACLKENRAKISAACDQVLKTHGQ
jgi:hypothetical protein